MNLTRLIEATGKRIRLGKPAADRLTNADVKDVLETAIEILKNALIEEGRVEIQDFCVIKVKRLAVKPARAGSASNPERHPIATPDTRIRWVIQPSMKLKRRLQR